MEYSYFSWRTSDEAYEYELWDDAEQEVSYRFNGFGAGLTAGAEFLTYDNNSIQLQLDVSLVKNSFNIKGGAVPVIDMENVTWASWLDDNGNIDEEWEGQKDYVMPMVTGSIGMSFFKPDPTNKEPLEPLPASVYNTGVAQPVFDPETGEKIPSAMRFDPETGEALADTQFDPETGAQVLSTAKKQKMPYDEVILQAKRAARSRHNRSVYNAAGVASCFIYPIGLPVAILYTESGVASNMNPHDPVYLDLDPGQKNQYKYAYKQEEKNLRRKSIYGAEGFCVGLFFFAIVSDGL